MRTVKPIIIALLLMVSAASFAQKVRPPKHEYRAVWMTTIENLDWPRTLVTSDGDIEKQKKELVQMLDSLRALNVNMVMLQTRVRGDVIYPSKIEPFSKVLTGVVGKNPGYDPLAFAIDECHKRDMQLHAWIVTLPLGKVQHVRSLGRLALKNKHPQLCRVYKGSWYMEPGEPGTVDYLCTLVNEIVSNYDVDGIHLDYVRYPDQPRNYPDGYLYRRYGDGRSLADWRRDNITKLVRGIYREVKRVKPWVRVSCAPLGKFDDLTLYSSRGYNARRTVFQDAQEWMREGIVDMIFPMLYFSGNDFYPFVLDWLEHSYGRHVAPGMGTYRLLPEYGDWDAIELCRQLVTSNSAGTQGTVMFRTRHLLDNIKGFSDMYGRVYDNFVSVPPITWHCKAPLPSPTGFEGKRVGNKLSLKWNRVDVQEGMPAARYNLYASSDSTIDISDVDNMMAVSLTDTTFVWNGGPYTNALNWAVTAVDAYGVESPVAIWYNKGYKPMLQRDEFRLFPARTWGYKVVLRDAVGTVLYKGAYREQVGVRGLPPGMYMLEVVNRDGVVLRRFPFSR